jgi:menaquinone-dependent protoporphyrinogen oxidase
MNRIAILYATREGHTRRIAEHVAAVLRKRGFESDVQDLRADPLDAVLSGYSGAVLAASVHAGQHESEMVRFVRNHRTELKLIPAAFLSVTLSEAAVEMADKPPQERARFAVGVQEVIDRFIEETGWQPAHVKPVAGALNYSQYNFFVRLIMKRIAREAGASTDTSRDYDYTDWEGLDRFIESFADEIAVSARV